MRDSRTIKALTSCISFLLIPISTAQKILQRAQHYEIWPMLRNEFSNGFFLLHEIERAGANAVKTRQFLIGIKSKPFRDPLDPLLNQPLGIFRFDVQRPLDLGSIEVLPHLSIDTASNAAFSQDNDFIPCGCADICVALPSTTNPLIFHGGSTIGLCCACR